MKKFPILYENSASFQCISVYCVGPSKLTVFNCFRDDTHMTLINIVQFSRSLTPLVHLRPKFFHSLDLGRRISNEPPSSPNDNQSIKRKLN